MDVLVTHYEQQKTLRDSAESLTNQLGSTDPIHVVDAGSKDGSFRILEELDHKDKVELLYRDGVSRGRGRQIAFEESADEIVIGQVDLDSIFYPVLPDLADRYMQVRSERGPGILLVHGCFVSDRETITRLGGWNDLQVHEDKDLWIRADQEATLYQLPISVVQQHDNFEWESLWYRSKRLYQNYRDGLRLGISREALARSYRAHQSPTSWPINATLLSIAARQAGKMETYQTIPTGVLDAEEFYLRELTFHTLVECDLIDPETLSLSSSFREYQSQQTYPGQTSYQ